MAKDLSALKPQDYEEIMEVMDMIEFEKIHKVMKFLGWTWGIPPHNDVPEIYELRKTCRELAFDAAVGARTKECEDWDGPYSCATGGFNCECWIDPEDDSLKVKIAFELTDYSNY